MKTYFPKFLYALAILLANSAEAQTIYLGGTNTTPGGQAYASAVILTNNTVLTSTGGGAITFSSTVEGAFSLTINTAGTTTFGGAVGGTTPLTSLTTDGSGSTSIDGGLVTTTGGQTYNDSLTLGPTRPSIALTEDTSPLPAPWMAHSP